MLLGNTGDDMLVGSPGRNILIGGLGLDRLVGGKEGDVVIGGRRGWLRGVRPVIRVFLQCRIVWGSKDGNRGPHPS